VHSYSEKIGEVILKFDELQQTWGFSEADEQVKITLCPLVFTDIGAKNAQ
jgi:hypothetical protein